MNAMNASQPDESDTPVIEIINNNINIKFVRSP